MMAKHILYFGSEIGAAALQTEVTPAYVYHAQEVMEALAMAVFYQPDVIYVDHDFDVTAAEQVQMHLQSIGVEPVMVYAPVKAAC